MADSEKPKLKGPLKPNEEPGSERRLLLAFALMGLVLFLAQYLYKPTAPQKTDLKQVEPPAAAQAEKPATPPPPAKPPAGQVAAEREQLFTVETELYRIVFSNQGAVARSWELKNYLDGTGKRLDLVHQEAAKKTHFPFSLVFESQTGPAELNEALYVGRLSPDGLGVEFEYSNGTVSARKTLRFKRDSYLSDVTSTVTRDGNGVPHMLAWRGGFGDRTVHAAAATIRTLYFDLNENELVEQEADVAESGPQTLQGSYSFAGIEDTYFAAVFLPADKQQLKIQTISDQVVYTEGGEEEAVAGVGLGGDARNQYALFVGPKDVDLLRRINPKLEGLVDFGWFAFIAKPLFLFLNWLNDNYIHNYGWSIVLATILINFALLPLKLSGMKGMKKMSSLQPEIQKINEKYKDISFRDPRKAQQNQEVMELYKKHGVNPLGAGCMPLLFQIPFFFAFYKVLSVAIELRGADWLWVNDLAQHDPWYLLPVVMVGTQFLLQKMTPSTSMDPAQQRMLMFMPLVMGFLFLRSPAGLVLYWMTSNLVGILQQWGINKTSVAPVPVAATAPAGAKPPARQPAVTRTASRKGKK